MKAIFTQNCAIVGNEEFGNQFNSFWSTKLIVACEESFIEKKVIIERIKALSTGDKITMNAKGRDQVEIDFFAKFILASNNEDTFIWASKDDIRYWVIKVPVFQGEENVNMLQDMIDEIPAFLDYLNNRKMHSKNLSRMWFKPELLKTEALEKLVNNSKTGIEKELYEYLKTIYFEFGESEVCLTPTDINNYVLNRRQDRSYLTKILRDNMKVTQANDGRVTSYKVPYWGDCSEGEPDRKEHKLKGRPFLFPAKDILTKYDLEAWEKIHGKPEADQQTTPEAAPVFYQKTIQDEIERQANELDKKEDLPF